MVLRAGGHGEESWYIKQGHAVNGQCPLPACFQYRQPDIGPAAVMRNQGDPLLKDFDSDSAVLQVRGTFLELASLSEAELPLSQRFRRSWSDSDLHASADAAGTGDQSNTEALSSPGSWASVAGDQGASIGEAESGEGVIDLTKVGTKPCMETKWNLNAAEWRPAGTFAVAELVAERPPDQTTIVLRRLPADWLAGGRAAILAALDVLGFSGLYDFVYAPADIQDMQSKGYAFVNFLTAEAAEEAMRTVQNLEEAPEVGWSVLQGLARHIARFRDSPIMHKSVPEEIQPVLFNDGFRMPFPSPQGQVRRPCLSRRAPRADKTHATFPCPLV